MSLNYYLNNRFAAMMGRVLTAMGFFILAGNILCAQPYYFRHYQVEQGLSYNSVTCTLQDEHGFMWFGTKDGLNRFDGYTFKIFRHDPQDFSSIGSNFILHLFEKDSQLWVGTDNGLYQYNEETENFQLLESTSSVYIRGICQDWDGNLWFIGDYTLYRYNERKQTLKTFDSDKFFQASAICQDASGQIWVSSQSGTLNKYETSTDSFTSFDVFKHSPPTADNWIEKLYSTPNGSILIGTQSQGVKLFDIKKADYQDLLTYDSDHAGLFVRDFVQRTPEEYWIATESGIYVYNILTNSFSNIVKSYNNPYSLSDNAVYSLFKDREGGIWAGTYFGGVNYFPRQYTFFEKFFPKVGENSISGNAVREICQDKYGNLWIGTEDGGLNKFNPESGRFLNFKPIGNESSISHFNIHGLLATGNELWVGTFHQGLDVLDIRSGKRIRHYDKGTRPGSLKSDFIFSLLERKSGEIIVGTSYGVYKYQPKSDDFKVLTPFPVNYHYTALREDSRGNLWAGTYNDGIYYYHAASGKKGFFKNDPKNPHSLSSNAINNIFEDSRQNIWISTPEGLNKFNPELGRFTRYTPQNGFPSNVIYSILEDNEQKLWISTSKGLVSFDPVTEKLTVYTKAHGLLSDQLNYNSAYQDSSGRMYFGSVKGLVSFNPMEFSQNSYIPPVYITGFQIQNKEISVNTPDSPLLQAVPFVDKITLSHDQSTFSLDFAALSYTAPGLIEYAYKMEGLDHDWVYLKTNRKVFFTDLPPGSYIFKVKGANSSGLWNEQPTNLHIQILPPFWASSWAYLFYSLLGIGLVYACISSYHQKTEKKNQRKINLLENQKEKEIYQAKIEFFTNVAHEIRTPLTLIKGPLERVIQKSKDMPEINENLKTMDRNTSRLLELVNQLLDFRKTETKGFSLNFVKADINSLVKETFERFKPAAQQKNISFLLQLIDSPLYAYVDREALIKIISNLFSNALKYSESMVTIRLLSPEQEPDSFCIEVKNDGHLIPAESREKIFTPFYRMKETENQAGTGIGLPLSRSLAELHKGSLELRAPEQNMNVFLLQLPLHQEQEYHLYDEQNQLNSEEEEGALANGSKPAILLVEDNKEMLDFLGGTLSAEYCLFKASNGRKALEILGKESIQLVVSDVMMPVMNGFELSSHLKANLEYSHIPVILLTAKNSLQSKIEGLESGADAYMDKPFSPEHLRVQIANLLSNRNKIKDYFASSPLAHMKSMAYSKADETFLEKLNETIYQNMTNTELNVEQLADIMNMSRPTLYRKIKAISDLTPNELINLARLKKAAELLAEGKYKIYEVASIVGYNSQTNFGRNFLKQFGMTPSEYVSSQKKILTE